MTVIDPAPFYDCHVFFCTNERAIGHPRGSCCAKGALELRTYMKERARAMGLEKIRVNAAGCLDRCELGPTVVIYPEGVWYRVPDREAVDRILKIHIKEGGRVPTLMLHPGDG